MHKNKNPQRQRRLKQKLATKRKKVLKRQMATDLWLKRFLTENKNLRRPKKKKKLF